MRCLTPIRQTTLEIQQITIWILLLAAVASAFEPGDRDDPGNRQVLKNFAQPIPGVDWEKLSPHYIEMMERMFERNGWTDESDRYAQRVASKVAALPPWDLTGRLRTLSEEVAQRYDLTPQQTAEFQKAIMRESMGLLMRHGPALWEQAREALELRSQGKPYTAEQIAEWARHGEPIFREVEQSVERVAGELEVSLSDEKKRVFAKDMAGFHKRQKAVEAMAQRWAKGDWKPDEWGLENDPIQTSRRNTDEESPAAAPIPTPTAPAAAPRPVAPLVAPAVAGPPIPDHWVEFDPKTWIALVIRIGKEYRLDSGQMDTAWSIHAEMLARARRYQELHPKELSAVPQGLRGTDDAHRPIRELFAELRERLESIPTSAQREASRK